MTEKRKTRISILQCHLAPLQPMHTITHIKLQNAHTAKGGCWIYLAPSQPRGSEIVNIYNPLSSSGSFESFSFPMHHRYKTSKRTTGFFFMGFKCSLQSESSVYKLILLIMQINSKMASLESNQDKFSTNDPCTYPVLDEISCINHWLLAVKLRFPQPNKVLKHQPVLFSFFCRITTGAV